MTVVAGNGSWLITLMASRACRAFRSAPRYIDFLCLLLMTGPIFETKVQRPSKLAAILCKVFRNLYFHDTSFRGSISDENNPISNDYFWFENSQINIFVASVVRKLVIAVGTFYVRPQLKRPSLGRPRRSLENSHHKVSNSSVVGIREAKASATIDSSLRRSNMLPPAVE